MKKLLSTEVREKARRFLDCRTMADLRHIGFDTNAVTYDALHPNYYTFEQSKSGGGVRTIEAPFDGLKTTQRHFNFYLQCVYYTMQHEAAYGYVIRVKDEPYIKNILGNARRHLGARYMLNVDFEGFFHQITATRILALLQTSPFRFDEKTAHTLVRIFTRKKRLPMGAPTSPVLSNIIALPLDEVLNEWAKIWNITYSRFVDDLTFSSKTQIITEEHFAQIKAICDAHVLRLNPKKTKYFGEADTKKVTKLILRDTVDIDEAFYNELNRDLQRLRHAAEVFMIVNNHHKDETLRKFRQEVEGQINFIGMIEGFKSPIFYKYRKKLAQALKPDAEALSARWTDFGYF